MLTCFESEQWSVFIWEKARAIYLVLAIKTLAKFQHGLLYAENYGMSVHSKLSLKGGQLATIKQEHTEHTLKTVRILLRSDFQAAIISLSFFA